MLTFLGVLLQYRHRVALHLLLIIAAPWIAAFYNMPMLTELTRFMTLSLSSAH